MGWTCSSLIFPGSGHQKALGLQAQDGLRPAVQCGPTVVTADDEVPNEGAQEDPIVKRNPSTRGLRRRWPG